jgi:hypothetical protein
MCGTGILRGQIIEIKAAAVPPIIVTESPATAIDDSSIDGPVQRTTKRYQRVILVVPDRSRVGRRRSDHGKTCKKNRRLVLTHNIYAPTGYRHSYCRCIIGLFAKDLVSFGGSKSVSVSILLQRIRLMSH